MMSDSKRSLALAITLQGVDAPHDFRRQVRRVEALGYTHLWLTDSSLHARYVYAYLTLAAVDTERLWLGTGVTHPFTRHPAMTVNAIATLDEISNGRAILGLGAGDRPTGELGFAPARLKDMRAMTRVARGLLNGETLDLQSDHFQLKGAQLHFEHRSNLAIYMFCSGPRMLSLAGEVADGVVAQCGVFPGAVDFAREKVAEGAARAGRSMDDIDMWVMACGALSDDNQTGLDRSRAMAAWFAQTAPHCCRIAGIDPDLVSQIQEAYRGGEFHHARDAAALATDDMVEKFTVGGSPEAIRARLEPLLEMGIRGINFMPIGPERPQSTQMFAEQVARPLSMGWTNA